MLQKLTFDEDAISKAISQQNIFLNVNIWSVAKSTRLRFSNNAERKGKIGMLCFFSFPFFFLFAVIYAF